ncbi:DUF3541 domain-containing protein [Vibrio rhizosphaerae]|uniref:DUF3541 domain-containing protein n=1 Tax=Vibrio rhizosphaerae TaxID=398736 RepID=A0ABU4J1P4_9VIBR|nr:DUF3541 domain-containing protein [Vibrio rhizosphaerae]MDW6094653.1 DUF3541 domain-containing protein [Vibrio rhizosphaerae]
MLNKCGIASILFIIFTFQCIATPNTQLATPAANEATTFPPSFQDSADQIAAYYEQRLYTLPAFKAGHYALRMYRQTLDNKYAAGIWQDMARVASSLNHFAHDVATPEAIYLYSQQRLSSYQGSQGERSRLRYAVTKHHPEYLYLGVDLLGAMARADEYGLKHKNDKQLRQILRRYDFSLYATDPQMIKAWAAQLANQVFWLKQLGEQDVVQAFIQTFRKTYPDDQDTALSKQQYENKIYGMTHIIIAASGYYQHKVSAADYQWIYHYFRTNIETIIARSKPDVIAEVGLSFLLAGLDQDPVVTQTRQAIQEAIPPLKQMIPSEEENFNLAEGEHRNLLAIMLLGWQKPHAAPKYPQHLEIFSNIPYGLEPRQSAAN